MPLSEDIIRVKVSAPFGCFTNVHNKMERVSYDIMTPSAARGILTAIFWKPEFKFYIMGIEILHPVKFQHIFVNEVRDERSNSLTPIDINGPKIRTQRGSKILVRPSYIINAKVYTDDWTDKINPPKYVASFMRRMKRGGCYRYPYMGTREFSLDFCEPTGRESRIKKSYIIKDMLFDMCWDSNGKVTSIFWHNIVVNNGYVNCDVEENEYLLNHSENYRKPMSNKELEFIYGCNRSDEITAMNVEDEETI